MNVDLFDLHGKKALVTGGAVGIGRACATALALSGADVAIVGRTAETGERTCELLRRLDVESFFIQCDVSDKGEVSAMTEKAVRQFGRLDIAVNNAGAGIDCSALDLDKSRWEWMINLNLGGVFWCAQSQARKMIEQSPCGGKIINIASMYATVPEGNCAYNASKAGVVHLTKTLASEWGASNINVNCISPGWMLTPGNNLEPALRERMREVTPLGCLMRYKDIYGAVIFLASQASDFITGHDLVIDGGHTAATYLTSYRRRTPARASPSDEEAGLIEDLPILGKDAL